MFKKGDKVIVSLPGLKPFDGTVADNEIEDTKVVWVTTLPPPGEEGGSFCQYDSSAVALSEKDSVGK
jgi:hypothetical protein